MGEVLFVLAVVVLVGLVGLAVARAVIAGRLLRAEHGQTCPACRKRIHAEATVCRFCGTPVERNPA